MAKVHATYEFQAGDVLQRENATGWHDYKTLNTPKDGKFAVYMVLPQPNAPNGNFRIVRAGEVVFPLPRKAKAVKSEVDALIGELETDSAARLILADRLEDEGREEEASILRECVPVVVYRGEVYRLTRWENHDAFSRSIVLRWWAGTESYTAYRWDADGTTRHEVWSSLDKRTVSHKCSRRLVNAYANSPLTPTDCACVVLTKAECKWLDSAAPNVIIV